MNSHYLIVADRGHLRIYHEESPPGRPRGGLALAEAMDFPGGRKGYTDGDADMAGRFPSMRGKGQGVGGAIDERLPMQREHERRCASDAAAAIREFLRANPEATWDLAAAPDFQSAVLDDLPPPVRERLQHLVPKDLTNVPLSELRAHFPRSLAVRR